MKGPLFDEEAVSEDPDVASESDSKRLRASVEPVRAPRFRFVEAQGDLFACAAADDSLAHCVSRCLAMSKGIAVEFKKRFDHVAELKAQNPRIGSGAWLERPGGGTVFYLVTKERYFHKPLLADLRKSLEWMRDTAIARGVHSIAMPRIGAGLDKLSWEEVKNAIREVFGETDICIKVFFL